MLLSMLTVSLMFRSRSDETAAQAGAGSEQAWAAAMSGVQEAMRVAAGATAGSTEWQDNPTLFRDRPVFEDGADQWFFTVYSPTGSEDTVEVRYGIDDEASRLNLNRPGPADLGHIPRMTPAMVQALKQFIGDSPGVATPVPAPGPDPGATPLDAAGPDGNPSLASIQEATAAALGVTLRHGPLTTLDELTLVPGFSWSLVHGEDANQNGHLDPNEDDGDEQFPPDNHDGRLDHGLAQYFTVDSHESDRTNDGRPRTNLNDPKDPLPPGDFPAAFTNFVASLRAAHQKLAHPADLLEGSIRVNDGQGNATEVTSGITRTELPVILDAFTTDATGRHDGLVNLNTASATVLATLPGIDAALAETITSTRTSISPGRRATIAWLFQEGLVDAPRFKQLAPRLTTRARQFRFQVLGYGLPSGRFRVLQAVIDVGGSEPLVTSLRDITRLGLPFKPGPDKAEPSAKETARQQQSSGVRHG